MRKILLLLVISLMTLVLARLSVCQDSPQDFVDAHNRARAEVDVGSISWDESLATYARDYANRRVGDCDLVHSRGPYGKNIAWSGDDASGVDAVNWWVEEKSDYDYDSNTCVDGKVCGHYTQVVWKNSVRLGCAKVRCNSGDTFIGCNYDPPGNWNDGRPY